jgi:hypothetical protein
MKTLCIALLGLSVAAFGQGRSGGAGRPAGAGSHTGGLPTDAGRPADVGRPAGTHSPNDHSSDHTASEKKELRESQLNGGAWRMLQEKTGKSSDELKAMYESSGATNFGQFTSAVIVSKNLGLDTNQVLDGLKTKSLGTTLRDLGVEPDKAKSEIKKAEAEAKRAAHQKRSS